MTSGHNKMPCRDLAPVIILTSQHVIPCFRCDDACSRAGLLPSLRALVEVGAASQNLIGGARARNVRTIGGFSPAAPEERKEKEVLRLRLRLCRELSFAVLLLFRNRFSVLFASPACFTVVHGVVFFVFRGLGQCRLRAFDRRFLLECVGAPG